jgi:hypothetical protein
VAEDCVFSLLALSLPFEVESLKMRVGLQFAAFENLVLVVLALLVAEKKFIHGLGIDLGFSQGQIYFLPY